MAHRYIGRNIYELRKKRGWSQSDLARKLDKKASTISSYETDSKTPSVDTIIAMSELFGVSIDELIYGENAEVLSTKHLAAEQKRAVADLLQGLTLYNDGNDKDGLARTRLLLQVIKAMGLYAVACGPAFLGKTRLLLHGTLEILPKCGECENFVVW